MSIEIRKPLKPVDTSPLQARRSVHEFMKSVLADRTLLLLIVTGGKAHWKRKAGKAWRGFASSIGPDTIEALWDQMVAEAGPDPKAELALQERAGIVKMKVDRLRMLSLSIRDEAHLNEVVEKCSTDPDERAAIRHYLALFLRLQGITVSL